MRNRTKNIISTIAALITLSIFTSCGSKEHMTNVEIVDWKPSKIYTDSDIEAAIQTVKEYFNKEFDGCTLTKITYAGDDSLDEYNEYSNRYNADETIVLYSSFDVDSSGGDGSLNPNSTYEDFNWILIRNKGGKWEHVDHGY